MVKLAEDFPFTILCRDRQERIIVGFGPLSRTFYLTEEGFLLRVVNLRYRYDDDPNTGTPEKHKFDGVMTRTHFLSGHEWIEREDTDNWRDFSITKTTIEFVSREVGGHKIEFRNPVTISMHNPNRRPT